MSNRLPQSTWTPVWKTGEAVRLKQESKSYHYVCDISGCNFGGFCACCSQPREKKLKKKTPGINHFKRHWSAMSHQNSFNVPRHLSMSLLVRVNTIAIIALIFPHLLWWWWRKHPNTPLQYLPQVYELAELPPSITSGHDTLQWVWSLILFVVKFVIHLYASYKNSHFGIWGQFWYSLGPLIPLERDSKSIPRCSEWI